MTFTATKTRNNDDLILEKVDLECTKRAFIFYRTCMDSSFFLKTDAAILYKYV